MDLEIAAGHGVNPHTAALWRGRVRRAGVGVVWEIQPGRGHNPRFGLQIQPLDRIQPGRPMEKGRYRTRAHDYKRHGTTLFAALSYLDGQLIGQCHSRYRRQEFLKFLRQLDREFRGDRELHLVVDSYAPPRRRK